MDMNQIASILEALDKIALSIHTPALTIVGAVLAGVVILLRTLAAAKPAEVVVDAPTDPVTKAALAVAPVLKLVEDKAVSAVDKAVADALKKL